MVLAEDKDSTRRAGKSISPREGRGREEGRRVVDQGSGPPNGEMSEVRGRALVALLAVSSRGGMTSQLDTGRARWVMIRGRRHSEIGRQCGWSRARHRRHRRAWEGTEQGRAHGRRPMPIGSGAADGGEFKFNLVGCRLADRANGVVKPWGWLKA